MYSFLNNKNRFWMDYYRKDDGKKRTALNYVYKRCDFKLIVIIASDDV